jgi:hypothetical protein
MVVSTNVVTGQEEAVRPGERLLGRVSGSWGLLLIASALAAIPVWLSTYPPMTDLPQHAAQVALLRNLHNPAFRFSGLFWINWFTPYLLSDLLLYAITSVPGIVTGCKLLVSVFSWECR